MSLENQGQATGVRAAIAQSKTDGGKENKHHPEDRARPTEERRESRRSETASNLVPLSQISRLNSTPLPMSGTAQALAAFHQDFVAAMPAKDDNSMLVMTVTPIDSSSAGIAFSALIVSGYRRSNPELGVGYHTFLLAGSAEKLNARDESYKGRRVKIVQVPGDGYDDDTRDVVRDALKRLHPGKNLYSGFAETIDADFPSAKDVPEAIGDCVKNALAAIKTAIDRNDVNAFKLSLAKNDDTPDTFNTIHVQHRQNHLFDRAHEPVRADVIIDLQTRANKGRNSRDSIDQLVPGTLISRLGGYWDLVYAPSSESESRRDSRRGRDRGGEYQTYMKRFITTFIDTCDFSPTTMLLAQATMNAAGDPQEIMRAFEPNQTLGEEDLRNIGVLQIEPNLDEEDRGFSSRMPTKSTSFNLAKRNALLKTVMREEIIWSIDVPECGASSWQYTDMLAAAEGNSKALHRIYDAAYDLTNGYIEDHWRRGDAIFDEHVERIHGGYHTEGTGGQRLDIRDLDYIALLNLLKPEVEGDLLDIQKWSIAATSGDDDLISQSDRFEIIQSFMPSARVTKFYRRFNYLAAWNEALVAAILDCDLSLNPTTNGRDAHERYRTTYGNLDNIGARSGTGGLYRNQRRGRHDRDDSYGYSNSRRDRHRDDDRY